LSDSRIPDPTFVVPDVDEDTVYTYTLTVTHGTKSSSDSVSIKVTSAKIKVLLPGGSSEIAPEIGRTTLPDKLIVDVPGVPHPVGGQIVQPHIDGGEAQVRVEILGVTNPINVPLKTEFAPLIDTGGHDHLIQAGDKPKQFDNILKRAAPAFGGFVHGKGKALETEINGKTDASGVFTTTFRAENRLSEYSSAGGIIEIKANGNIPTEGDLLGKETLTIRWKELGNFPLVPLLDGTNYDLIGSDSVDGLRHPDSHYGTEAVVDALTQISDKYAAVHTNDRLRYNDMSLVFGGVFDISGDWDPAGKDGHKFHACGVDIDIDDAVNRFNPINKKITKVSMGNAERDEVAKIVSEKYPGVIMITEGNHFHVHFVHCQ
jgi:hypothetical protein